MRSIVIRRVALQLGVQVLATKISDYDLVANKMAAYASLENSRDITCQLVIPIPRDHRAGFAYDTRNKEINTIFEILTEMFIRIQIFWDVIMTSFSAFLAHTVGDCCDMYPSTAENVSAAPLSFDRLTGLLENGMVFDERMKISGDDNEVTRGNEKTENGC
jgi:hypothetical protein